MVGEFPDLQGIMGRYYALHDKEPAAVADAIAEHYSPLGPGDACPSKALSVVVSLADKLDSLVGFFAINEKPTGSKDPYALRRAALGVIRIILENKLRLPLRAAFGHALAGYTAVKADTKKVTEEVLEFFADRLKVYLREKGMRHDYVTAVFALGTEDDLVRLIARVEALGNFLASDDGANLLVAYRRAANIVRIEEKKDNKAYAGDVSAEALGAPEAEALLGALTGLTDPLQVVLDKEAYAAAMKLLAQLRGPVDAFFDKVTVNTDNAEQRVARLKLLSRIVSAMNQVADFSKIEG
jgi:glycyl-tRNA synthetase beta chain